MRGSQYIKTVCGFGGFHVAFENVSPKKKKNKTSFSCRDWLKKGLYFVVIDMMQNGVINETEFQAHSTEFFLTLSSSCPNLSYHENEWVCCFLSNQRGTCILLPTLQS